ncbi:MAG: sucrose phosphorylase [Chloroflexota bacterium]
MKNQVQLIAYADRFGCGGIAGITRLLDGPLAGLFGGIHLLPFYYPIHGSDAGFDPIDHTSVDACLGGWHEVGELGKRVDVMADLIVNHISSQSPQFLDYCEKGEASAYNGLFLTLDGVFPNGATETDLLRIYRPRPGLPFTSVTLKDGQKRLLWTTFTSEQIDIDVTSSQGQAYLQMVLETLHDNGIRMLRLDAAGYAVKKAGSSCFMIPETFAFIEALTQRAKAFGIEVLVEIHAYYRKQIEIARHVDRVYDFALPPLILHAIFNHTAQPLAEWLAISPRNAITVLDTHDGIGVMDVRADSANPHANPGLISPAALDGLVERIHINSQGQSRQATGAAASNLDLYQVNSTFYDALARNDEHYLLARAIQFFAPGVPQVYYVGLLAGENDMALLRKSGVGRDINRHYYTCDEIEQAVQRPVVQSLFELIRFRNRHPAFNGTFSLPATNDGARLAMRWDNGDAWALLEVSLVSGTYHISNSVPGSP